MKTLNSMKTLGRASKLKRKREEGKGKKKKKRCNKEEKSKVVDIREPYNMLEDDHNEGEGFDNESTKSKVVENLRQDPDENDSGLTEGSEIEDVEFHSDEEDIGINGQTAYEDSTHLSFFDLHLQHSLSKEEIDCKSNVKFSWETPAIGMKNCKWIGTGKNIMEGLDINSCHGLKEKLSEHWMDVYKTSGGKDMSSPKQSIFFSLCSSYRDILYCNKRPFYLKGLEDASIMDAYIMHSLNHVFRTRDSVKKNDAKLTKLKEYTESDKFRDQGFTRPKVLILLPLASIMYRVVKRLIHLTPSAYKVNVEHKDRFTTKFGSEEDTGDIENVDESENSKAHKSSKASDFQMLFGGNNEDDFMIGIKFTRKTIKLFSDFHTSDIIIASALCLVNKIEEAGINKEKDVDFLSSIENWSHVHTVIEHLNRLPSKQPGTDVMRIRPWYLDDHARFYRQTIILGFYSNPDINASFNHQCVNYEGKVKLMCEYKGVLHKVLPEIRQIYERFDVDSIVEADDARFDYFITKVFPRIKDLDQLERIVGTTPAKRMVAAEKGVFVFCH
ncbi:hypothetical protein LR48_Vigan04g003600 [Vigna angularis]|uniref:UTP25 NTP hydrolase-like domain-containing protein n=1 Tax=Phaseolus angularis TaxID=3914 RepID=A0A0L9UAQ8_PHAAN|nr:hypothetical protein LR48_Vigan04g003600 [Vigna angularis]